MRRCFVYSLDSGESFCDIISSSFEDALDKAQLAFEGEWRRGKIPLFFPAFAAKVVIKEYFYDEENGDTETVKIHKTTVKK